MIPRILQANIQTLTDTFWLQIHSSELPNTIRFSSLANWTIACANDSANFTSQHPNSHSHFLTANSSFEISNTIRFANHLLVPSFKMTLWQQPNAIWSEYWRPGESVCPVDGKIVSIPKSLISMPLWTVSISWNDWCLFWTKSDLWKKGDLERKIDWQVDLKLGALKWSSENCLTEFVRVFKHGILDCVGTIEVPVGEAPEKSAQPHAFTGVAGFQELHFIFSLGRDNHARVFCSNVQFPQVPNRQGGF